jgi:CRP-like cAMP-binding protein
MPASSDLDPHVELPLVQGFGDLAPEALAELASLVTQKRALAQETVAPQGHVPQELLLLVRGAAKAVRTVPTEQGPSVVVLEVMRASCVVPEPGVIDGLVSDVSIVALRASHFFRLERRALLALASAHPSLDRALFARFLSECRGQVRRIDELASGSVEERVRHLLEGLSAQHGTQLGQGRFIAIPLRRRDIASMVNATTETVSRLLAKFEREGRARSTRDGIWWRAAAKTSSRSVDSEPSVAPPQAEAPSSRPAPLVRGGLVRDRRG